MDSHTTWVIGGILAVMVVVVVVAGPKLKKISLVFGKWFSARAEAEQAGPTIKKIDADGEDHDFKAKGSGAAISDVKVRGKGNTFTAEN